MRDSLKFPDLIHEMKRDPRISCAALKINWDFWTSQPEALG
jgi:catalase